MVDSFADFITYLLDSLSTRIQTVMTTSRSGYYPSVSRTVACARFLKILRILNTLKLSGGLKNKINTLYEDYNGEFKKLLLSLFNDIFSNETEKTRRYCFAISYSLKLYSFKQENDETFVNSIVGRVSETESNENF